MASKAFEDIVPSASIPPVQAAASLAPATHSVVIDGVTPPASPVPDASFTSPTGRAARPSISRAQPSFSSPAVVRPPGFLYPPATGKGIDYDSPNAEDWDESMGEADMVLELADGLALSGHSFGAKKSVAGECVFQTGQSLLRIASHKI